MECLIEHLEPRRLFAAVTASDVEVYMVELINRARANPVAEAARYGISLNEGVPSDERISTAPKQPLAINSFITDAARGHSKWMIDHDIFSHDGVNGSDPGDRLKTAGYKLIVPWTWGENIGYRSRKPSTPEPVATSADIHEDLFIDEGIADRGHRTNMMNAAFREIGAGILSGEFDTFNAVMVSTDFGSSGTGAFITGVAYDDSVAHDKFYNPGEGLGALTITARRKSDNAVFTTSTAPSGAYSLKLTAGTYAVSGSGGELGGTVNYDAVSIGTTNVKLDFTPDDVNAPTGVISGLVYKDLNGNGLHNSNDPDFSGVKLFLDTNRNSRLDGAELTATTNASGEYEFEHLPAGAYRILEVVPNAWRVSYPGSGVRNVSLGDAQTVEAQNFGNTQRVLISGNIYEDLNANRTRDGSETALAAWDVFIDADADGRLDPDEIRATTNSAGNFQFAPLSRGTYRVRAILQTGYVRTTASFVNITLGFGQVSPKIQFGVKTS